MFLIKFQCTKINLCTCPGVSVIFASPSDARNIFGCFEEKSVVTVSTAASDSGHVLRGLEEKCPRVGRFCGQADDHGHQHQNNRRCLTLIYSHKLIYLITLNCFQLKFLII